ncbi:T9SS type A sorting domain-containing protein [Cognatitamlana onchidii]|uniref:T9SS type A sorting domain-containing protein n=1 Tax=Cognatitamlana onchidii TaxID=2562860 RepID=UPI0010A6752D|nr:T9SS type A sorting domain-containing protein [Algibacter onchidii]
MKQLLILILCPFFLIGQTQIGQDIDGKDSYVDNLFGKSVAMSSDGTIVAAGTPNNDDINGNNSGQLRVYKNINGTWIQIGNDISGDVSQDNLGESVSLSSDGSIVAVGAPGNFNNLESSGYVKIYQNINDNWVQIGNDINGAAAGDEFGFSVNLSSDGSIVAIGAQNAQNVSIYKNISGIWTQVGSTIESEGNEWFRFSLSLSDDGNILAIGAPHSFNGNNLRTGLTRIYENIAGTWTQVGNDIDGEANRDQSGFSIDLSSNGSIVAIGAVYNNGSINSSGHVRVYENIGNSWTQIGNDIDAQIGDIRLGHSVSLSSDGSVIAIGAPTSSTNNYRSGLVRVYRYNGVFWNSVGLDINGEGKQDYSGESVSLSSDGNTIVIGATRNSGNGLNSGHIRVFENINDTWTQIGNDIDGDIGISGDNLGESVSLSSDGTILAIGAPRYDSAKGSVRIYENINGNWIQKGDDIIGEANHDLSGSSVSMSSNGNIVAIGAPRHDGINGFNSGYVRVFEFNNGNWTQIGSDIYEPIINNFGESISLSANGNIVAIDSLIVYENINNNWVKLTEDITEQSLTIGAQNVSLSSNGTIIAVGVPSDNTLTGGRVYIFENINGIWTQKGNDITGEAEYDASGFSLSLSSDGNIVAIGAPFNDGTEEGSDTGHVRVYKYINNAWTQIGDDIDGEAANYNFGLSLELSSDGSIVAIGSPFNNGNGTASGHVRLYKNINDVWTQIGNDIDGEAAEDFSGTSVSLSADGKVVVIGAPNNDDNGLSSGHARVYDLSAILLSTKSFERDYFSYYPNPVKDILNINLNKDLELKQVNIYNIQSQYLYSVNSSKIDVSQLSSGVYFIEVVTNEGKSAKKIVID